MKFVSKKSVFGYLSLALLALLLCPQLFAERIILTGPPGSGKTSIAIALEMRGEKILREAPTDIIHYNQALGTTQPWAMSNFQELVATLQLRRESTLPVFKMGSATSSAPSRIFLDRSVFDCFGYMAWLSQAPSNQFSKLFAQFPRQSYRQDVFLVLGRGEVKQTEIRSESLEQAIAIEANLRKAYKANGFNVIDVPHGPLEKRVDFILAHLNGYQQEDEE